MSLSLYTYPWNVHDAAAVADRVRGMGLDTITLATAYHAGKFLQPGDAQARVYFPEDGAVYFTPRRSDYGMLQPLQAATASGVLDELTKHIAVNAWTVLNHNNRLGLAHPEATARNCFGDAYPFSLCPAQPSVRDYDIALCRDIADQHDIASLTIETPGWLTHPHGYHHEFAQVPANAWLNAMIGLCFCPACRAGLRQDGIDASALAQDIASAIDDCLADDAIWGEDQQAEELLRWKERLVAYHQWRARIVTELVRDLRAAIRTDVAVRVISTTQRPHTTAYLEGHDLPALHAVSDGLELPLYQPSAEAVEADLAHVIERTGSDRLSAILRPGHPDMASEAQLNDAIDRVRGQGVRDLAFYNFGMLRPTNLGWLERSIARIAQEG